MCYIESILFGILLPEDKMTKMQPSVAIIPRFDGRLFAHNILRYSQNYSKGKFIMSISVKLQQLRKSNGMSQEQLAEKLEVSRQAVSKWESGSSSPDIEKIALLSKLFNVSTDYLIKDEETPKNNQFIQQSMQIPKKLYIIDINKRKLSTFEEFSIEMISADPKGEATYISGLTEPNRKVRVPVCALYGITKGILGMNKQTLLGFYASVEEAKKELCSISKASETDTVYELKYAAKMQGLRIADSD